jgi:hypothetical protein
MWYPKASSMIQFTKKLESPSESGAVFVEFAVMTPFLILIFAGLLDLSRIFNEFVWASNTAYQLASVLGGNEQSVAEDYMNERFRQITSDIRNPEFPGLGLFDDGASPTVEKIWGSYYDSANRVVGLKFTANIRPLNNINFTVPLSVMVVAPNLIPGAVAVGASKNPSQMYDCCGNVCSAGYGNGCAQLACPQRADLCTQGTGNECPAGSPVCPAGW